MPTLNKEQSEKLLKLVQDAVSQDNDLREQHNIGDKFRFIRDRLNALLKQIDESITSFAREDDKKKPKQASEDEIVVYIYLFNAQGMNLSSWTKMVSASVLYEYSVNRPIYKERSQVEAAIRAKSNKAQHGFITIAVNKADILTPPQGAEPAKDAIGNPVFKVREGKLAFDRIISFTHQEHEYLVGENGQLTKKTE